MNTLDKDKLDSLVESVTLARKLGFESLSSPVEPLLEAAIDVCLLLEKSFNEGRLSQKKNPSIKELDVSDELGNPKMLKVFKKQSIFFDPRVAEIIKHFTAFFVLLKRSSDEALSFMESILRTRHLPQVKPVRLEQKKPKATTKVQKRAKAAYYRRQQRRSSNRKT